MNEEQVVEIIDEETADKNQSSEAPEDSFLSTGHFSIHHQPGQFDDENFIGE